MRLPSFPCSATADGKNLEIRRRRPLFLSLRFASVTLSTFCDSALQGFGREEHESGLAPWSSAAGLSSPTTATVPSFPSEQREFVFKLP